MILLTVKIFAGVLMMVSLAAAAQQATPATSVVLENDYVRVRRLQALNGVTLALPPTSYRAFMVLLTDSCAQSSVSADTAASQPAGTVLLMGGGAPKIVGTSDQEPCTLLFAELKRVANTPPIKSCDGANCTRPIRIAGTTIGGTTTLFSNGFVIVYRHHLDRGGSLTSSYYSARGSDHMLFVPITELDATFGGIAENLLAGQPYFADASEVDVSATEHASTWVVIRLNEPAAAKSGTQ